VMLAGALWREQRSGPALVPDVPGDPPQKPGLTWDVLYISDYRECILQGRTELIGVDFVPGNYFPVLGIGAAIGHVFTASDDLIRAGIPWRC